MTTYRQVTVSEWSESQDTVIRQERDSRRFWSPAVIGLAGTLLLHGLALRTALPGGRSHRIPPPEIRELGSSRSEITPAESLVFIDIPNPVDVRNRITDSLAWARAAIATNRITVSLNDLSPPLDAAPLARNDDENAQSNVASGDGAEHARLLGIYSGQIQARVERIWSRPRTPVSDNSMHASAANAVEYFHCQAQVVQDSTGNVQEILLPNCNGSVAWQRSLVLAIQQASPLPAPPSPSVFSRTISLNFIGYPYVLGGSDEGYESSAVTTAKVGVPEKTPEEISRQFLSFRPIDGQSTSTMKLVGKPVINKKRRIDER